MLSLRLTLTIKFDVFLVTRLLIYTPGEARTKAEEDSDILTYLSYLKKGYQLIYEIRVVYGVPAPENGSTIWFRLNDVVLGELKVGPYEFNLKKSKDNE